MTNSFPAINGSLSFDPRFINIHEYTFPSEVCHGDLLAVATKINFTLEIVSQRHDNLFKNAKKLITYNLVTY